MKSPWSEPLTTFERTKAQRLYYIFSSLNGVSFRLLAGGIITLYALRLGADNTLVGLFESFMYLSLAFLLAGRPLVARFGAISVFGSFWALRYLAMIPALLTAIPAIQANRSLTFILLGVGVFGFHTAKGIAIASEKPILGEVAGDRDRGAFLSRVQSLNQGFALAVWLVMGLVMYRNPPPQTYALFFAAGIVAGLAASGALFRLPEPRGIEKGYTDPLMPAIRRGFRAVGFRRFIALFFMMTLAQSMAGPFLIVFFKRLYQHTDASVVYITLLGGLGVMVMAVVAGLFMDRVGAKPLYFAFAVTTALTMVPVFALPAYQSGLLFWLVPGAVFFLYQLGAVGMSNCSQDYFFATVRLEDRLNLGVVYNVTAGISGFAGAFGGGVILDALENAAGFSPDAAFRLYFGCLAGLLIVVGLMIRGLPDIGAYSVLNTLSIIFSPRDVRAVLLLRRLGRYRSIAQEQATIRELGQSPSLMSVEGLLARLSSPSFAVRSAALKALRSAPIVPAVTQALVTEVREHHFTTAHTAAEILGNWKITEAIHALREALDSDDFLLVGKAMVSLAQLRDRHSIPQIRSILVDTANPSLIIHATRAMVVFRDPFMIPVLLDKLEPSSAPFVRDEIVLAVAEIAGLSDWFYPLYCVFLTNEAAGVQEMRSILPPEALEGTVGQVLVNVIRGSPAFATAVLETLESAATSDSQADVAAFLVAALNRVSLVMLPRFRFLVAGAVIWFAGYAQRAASGEKDG
ncbi:MAG TPA: MFS transporter [Spirochaetia bacterium]|nr:MFS transporter [Spirochaetia bacterium]